MSDASYWASAQQDEIGAEIWDRKDRFYEITRASGMLAIWQNMWSLQFGAIETVGDIVIAGENGEQIRMKVGHLRNVAQHLTTMVTRQRVTWQPKAINTDSKSQSQSILARGILEYDMKSKRIDSLTREVCDMAVSLGEGGIFCEWDTNLGDIQAADPTTQESVRSGAVKCEVMGPLDIIRDTSKLTNRDHDWLIVRRFMNKWNLAAQAGDEETKKAIESLTSFDPNDPHSPVIGYDQALTISFEKSDMVAVYELFHKPTPALPVGRHTVCLGADLVVQDEAWDKTWLPIFRMHGAPIIGRPWSYSNLFDAMQCQRGIDALYSSVATNNTLATQVVAVPNGSNINVEAVTGMKILEYDAVAGGKPEPMNFVQSSPETYKFIQTLERNIELLSGINSTARGNPEASLKSGAALALVQSQALEFSQALVQSYAEFLEDLGTAILELYKQNASERQTALIVGRGNRSFVKDFVGSDIDKITRVHVELGSPLASSLAGKTQMAEQLLQAGLIKSPQQYMLMIQTGRLDDLTQDTTNDLLNIRAENEDMSDGKEVEALEIDNHPAHIAEHSALLASPDSRRDPQVRQLVMDHIIQHIDIWSQTPPALLAALGIPPMPEAPMTAPMGPPAPGELGPMPVEPEPSTGVQMPLPAKNPMTGEEVAQPVSSPTPPGVMSAPQQ